ncbi:hypothetical protein G6F68_021432 [Rhizopus microsporus]|nr:hypothetical protein G6F68_021432 [Rhizopus microsporus]
MNEIQPESQPQQQFTGHIDQWRMNLMSPDIPGSTVSSMTPSEDLIEEPILQANATPANLRNYAKSVSEVDFK